ncbi:MAG TPA: hypothetical protein VGR14_22380 [Verrucomicrobiae bacterium]|jgi:hypothetical protein|nr:hypothetical protein [Verrucomicrobiae bacterium]
MYRKYKKLHWFTVVAICQCGGCDDASEVHRIRGLSGNDAAGRLKERILHPGEDLPQAGREIEVIAVFNGRLMDQGDPDEKEPHLLTDPYAIPASKIMDDWRSQVVAVLDRKLGRAQLLDAKRRSPFPK